MNETPRRKQRGIRPGEIKIVLPINVLAPYQIEKSKSQKVKMEVFMVWYPASLWSVELFPL